MTSSPDTGSAGTDFAALQELGANDLHELAEAEGLHLGPHLDRAELAVALFTHRLAHGGTGYTEGVLEVLPEGYAFLRSPRLDYRAGPHDVYVSPSQVHALNLRTGHQLAGPVRGPKPGENYFALSHIDRVNGTDTAQLQRRVAFAARTPVLPRARLHLDHGEAGLELRAIERLAPWGMGQRVLVSAPAEFDRARFVADLAVAVRHNHAPVRVLACLLDQRPEDIAALRRRLAADRLCEVAACSFDEPPSRQVAVADATLARAQCEVEAGRDVVLLCDSLTALARASNLVQPPSGRLLCAGLDATAVLRPKRLFAAARACAEGGSLTVVATVLDGGESRIDEVVREELLHRGNSEVVFDRSLVARRAELALDVVRTRTRTEDTFLSGPELAAEQRWRLELASLPAEQRLAAVLARLAPA